MTDQQLNTCTECGGALKTSDGRDAWIDSHLTSDSYGCTSCSWSSDDIGDGDDFNDWDSPAPDKTCCKCGAKGLAIETVLEGKTPEEDTTEGEMCYDCATSAGYCFGCGRFSAGLESFDFGPLKGYCENCQEEIRANDVRDEDYTEDDEYFEEWMRMQ